MDLKLGQAISNRPHITSRRARTLKNIIAPSKLKEASKVKQDDISLFFDKRMGIFRCGKRRCLTCQFIVWGQTTFQDGTGKTYNIRQFITCSTDHVIYGLQCLCNLVCGMCYMPTVQESRRATDSSRNGEIRTVSNIISRPAMAVTLVF